MGSDSVSIPLSLDAGTGNTCNETIRSDGILRSIRISFPSSRNTVEARVFLNSNQIIPSHGISIIDNGPVEFPVNQYVHIGDLLTLEGINNDTSSSHTLSLTAVLEQDNSNQVNDNQSFYSPMRAQIEPVSPSDNISSSSPNNSQSLPISQGNTSGSAPGGPPLPFVSKGTPPSSLPPQPNQTQGQGQFTSPIFTPRPLMRPPPSSTSESYQSGQVYPQTQQQNQGGISEQTMLLLVLLVGALLIAMLVITLHYNKRN